MEAKKAILYTRTAVKTNAQDLQMKQLNEYCKGHNLKVVKKYGEYASGLSAERPQWNKLTLFVNQNPGTVDVILVSTYERITRRTAQLFKIIKDFQGKGVEIIPVNIEMLLEKKAAKKKAKNKK